MWLCVCVFGCVRVCRVAGRASTQQAIRLKFRCTPWCVCVRAFVDFSSVCSYTESLFCFFCLQWVEESFTNFDKGINWRSYVVCDVAYNNVNNWLWTPFIERGIANRIYIEIKFTIRDCSLFPGNALSCKETFSLLYYEFDAATKEPPPWEPESYKMIGEAPSPSRFGGCCVHCVLHFITEESRGGVERVPSDWRANITFARYCSASPSGGLGWAKLFASFGNARHAEAGRGRAILANEGRSSGPRAAACASEGREGVGSEGQGRNVRRNKKKGGRRCIEPHFRVN